MEKESHHTCISLDEASDQLDINHSMHVKGPAGSWDIMVFNTHSHTIFSPHLLLSILPPSAMAHPSSSLKFSRSDST